MFHIKNDTCVVCKSPLCGTINDEIDFHASDVSWFFYHKVKVLLAWRRKIDHAYISKFRNLKAVIRYGVGFDNVDLDAGKLVLSPTRTYAPIIKSILSQCDKSLIKGYTFNPTLFKILNVTDYLGHCNKLLETCENIPVSLEVFADDEAEMIRQGKILDRGRY